MSGTALMTPLQTSQVWRGKTTRTRLQRLPRGCRAGITRPTAPQATATRAAASAASCRPTAARDRSRPTDLSPSNRRKTRPATSPPARRWHGRWRCSRRRLTCKKHREACWLSRGSEGTAGGRLHVQKRGRMEEDARSVHEDGIRRTVVGRCGAARRANAGEEDVRGPCRARRPPATPARARGGEKRRIPAPDCMAAGGGTGDSISALEPLATPSAKQCGGARVGASQGVHGACAWCARRPPMRARAGLRWPRESLDTGESISEGWGVSNRARHAAAGRHPRA